MPAVGTTPSLAQRRNFASKWFLCFLEQKWISLKCFRTKIEAVYRLTVWWWSGWWLKTIGLDSLNPLVQFWGKEVCRNPLAGWFWSTWGLWCYPASKVSFRTIWWHFETVYVFQSASRSWKLFHSRCTLCSGSSSKMDSICRCLLTQDTRLKVDSIGGKDSNCFWILPTRISSWCFYWSNEPCPGCFRRDSSAIQFCVWVTCGPLWIVQVPLETPRFSSLAKCQIVWMNLWRHT